MLLVDVNPPLLVRLPSAPLPPPQAVNSMVVIDISRQLNRNWLKLAINNYLGMVRL